MSSFISFPNTFLKGGCSGRFPEGYREENVHFFSIFFLRVLFWVACYLFRTLRKIGNSWKRSTLMLVLCVCLFGRDWDTVAPPGFFFLKKCLIHLGSGWDTSTSKWQNWGAWRTADVARGSGAAQARGRGFGCCFFFFSWRQMQY